jgi:MFS family permease
LDGGPPETPAGPFRFGTLIVVSTLGHRVRLPAQRDDPSVTVVAVSLTVGVFFGGLAGGVAFPTLPKLGTELGIAPVLVGAILAINRATRLVLNTPAGTVLDRMGTRRPMVAGFGVMAAAPFGYLLGLDPGPVPLSSATVFLLARVCWGVGSAFVFVGAFSTITHVTTPDNRGRWTGYMRGGQSLGFPSGLVVGGLVTDAYGFATAFAVAGVAGLLATVVAAIVLPNVDPDVPSGTGLAAIPRLVRRDPRIGAVGVVNLGTRFLFAGILLSTVVLYASERGVRIGGFSDVGVSGFVMALSVVFSSTTTVVTGRLSDRLENRATVTVPALAALGAGFATLALGHSLLATLAGVSLVGVGVGGTNPPLLAYLGDISPAADVGKLGGVYNLFGDLGSTLGPLVALPLVSTLGFRAGYLVCVAIVALTAVPVVGVLLGASTEPRLAEDVVEG